MAGFIPAIHFPEAVQALFGLWKMDGRHKGGHDEAGKSKISRSAKSLPVIEHALGFTLGTRQRSSFDNDDLGGETVT